MKITKYRLELCERKLPVLKIEEELDVELHGLESPNEVIEILRNGYNLHKLATEHMILLCLNTKLQPIATFQIAQGGPNSCCIEIPGIFTRAVLSNARGILLAHNHPSDDVEPSSSDLKICERIKEAGALIGVQLVDFIIVGGDNSFSFRKHDLI